MRPVLFAVLSSALFLLVPHQDLPGAEPQLAHMVYFKLKESNETAQAKLVAACHKYLSGHDGTVYFSVGTLAKEFERDVNDRNFDVALNLVFANKASHDKYQKHPRHLKFIEENKDAWSNVRVFDSYVKVSALASDK